MTPSGIEPATFRFVAQHLNHCATAVPLIKYIVYNKVLSRYKLIYCAKSIYNIIYIDRKIYVSFYLSVCLSIYLPVCLSIYLSAYIFLSLSIHLSTYLPIQPYIQFSTITKFTGSHSLFSTVAASSHVKFLCFISLPTYFFHFTSNPPRRLPPGDQSIIRLGHLLSSEIHTQCITTMSGQNVECVDVGLRGA